MDEHVPLGPPELSQDPLPAEPTIPETPKTPTIQLIKSTQARSTPLQQDASEEPDTFWEEPDTLNEHVEEPGDPDGVVAAEQAQQYSEQHPEAVPITPKATKRRKHRFLKFVIFVVVVGAAGYGAFWIGNYEAGKNSPPKPVAKAAPAPPKPTAPTTKQYTSANFSLSFNYPSDWSVQEASGKLTVTSPAVSLSTATGSKSNVHAVVTVQSQQTTIPGYPANGATASLASDKLTYVHPTSVQRAQTYVSYLGYSSASGLDALYVTGDYGYLQDQVVPEGDVAQGNPLIGVTFESCASDCAHAATPVTLLASDWPKTSISKALIDLLQSIQLN